MSRILVLTVLALYLRHEKGLHHIETSSLICRTIESIGFYMIRISIMKELRESQNRELESKVNVV